MSATVQHAGRLRPLRAVALALVWTVVLAAVDCRRAAEAAAPQLSCALDLEQPPPPGPQPPAVSNLKRIPLRAFLPRADQPLDELRAAPAPDQGPATLTLTATPASAGSKASVPVKVSVIGTSQDPRGQELRLLVEIPVDEARRTENIRRYLERVVADGEKRNPDDRHKLQLRLMREKPELFIGTFENLYVENRTGVFDLTCAYSSKRAGFWNGEVRARPVRVEVVSKGEFFDQPEFRIGGPPAGAQP